MRKRSGSGRLLIFIRESRSFGESRLRAPLHASVLVYSAFERPDFSLVERAQYDGHGIWMPREMPGRGLRNRDALTPHEFFEL